MDHTKRQKEIMENAIRIISENGIQGLTVKNLSLLTGVTEPAIYRHFNDKQDILLMILDHFHEEIQSIYSLIGNTDNADIKTLERVFTLHIEKFIKKPFLASTIFSEEFFQNNDALISRFLNILDLEKDSILDIAKKAQKNGSIRSDIPPEHVVHIFLGSLRLLVKKWHFEKYGFDLKKRSNEFISSFKKIIKNI